MQTDGKAPEHGPSTFSPRNLARALEAGVLLAPWLAVSEGEVLYHLRAPGRSPRPLRVGLLSLSVLLAAPPGKRRADVARARALALGMVWSLHAATVGSALVALAARGELRRGGVRC